MNLSRLESLDLERHVDREVGRDNEDHALRRASTKVEPRPGSLSSDKRPPCASASSRAMERPSPAPGLSRSRCSKGSKTRSCSGERNAASPGLRPRPRPYLGVSRAANAIPAAARKRTSQRYPGGSQAFARWRRDLPPPDSRPAAASRVIPRAAAIGPKRRARVSYQGREREAPASRARFFPANRKSAAGRGGPRLRRDRLRLPRGRSSLPRSELNRNWRREERLELVREAAREMDVVHGGQRPAQRGAVPRMRPGAFGWTFLIKAPAGPLEPLGEGPAFVAGNGSGLGPGRAEPQDFVFGLPPVDAGSRLLPPPMVLLASASFSR